MLQNTRKMYSYAVYGRDGAVGTVDDLFFDDEEWITRYLVVDISDLILNRRVLIDPSTIESVDDERKIIHVDLESVRIVDSPEVDTEMPISRQYEVALRRYYEWPIYWGQVSVLDTPLVKGLRQPQIPEENGINAEATGIVPGVTDEEDLVPDSALSAMPTEGDEEELQEMEFAGPEEEEPEQVNTHLRAARELTDYRIESDGKMIGVVYDLMLDRDSWTIRYVITSSQNRRGSYSLIPFQMVKQISWPRKQIRVSIAKEALAKSPQYDPSKPVSPELEEEIFNYFDQVEYEM